MLCTYICEIFKPLRDISVTASSASFLAGRIQQFISIDSFNVLYITCSLFIHVHFFMEDSYSKKYRVRLKGRKKTKGIEEKQTLNDREK